MAGSSLKVSLVPWEYVQDVWLRAAPFLESALARAPDRFTGGDIFLLVSRGIQNLWVVMDGSDITAACTTRIYDTPQSRVLIVEWLGGERLAEWLDDALIVMEQFARDNGCNKIEGSGRKGWEKMLKGWRYLATTYERDLD